VSAVADGDGVDADSTESAVPRASRPRPSASHSHSHGSGSGDGDGGGVRCVGHRMTATAFRGQQSLRSGRCGRTVSFIPAEIFMKEKKNNQKNKFPRISR